MRLDAEDVRCEETRIVEPDDVHVLDPSDRTTLTLVTCYPFTFIGNAPQRYVVSADLVSEEWRLSRLGESGAPGG